MNTVPNPPSRADGKECADNDRQQRCEKMIFQAKFHSSSVMYLTTKALGSVVFLIMGIESSCVDCRRTKAFYNAANSDNHLFNSPTLQWCTLKKVKGLLKP